MGLKGDLNTVGLADLFQMITMSRKEGTLVVQDKESRKCIFFGHDGVHLLSAGRRKGFRLGEYFLKKGKIDAKDLEKALKIQKKSGQKLGEVLVSEKMVSEEEVHTIVRAQIEGEIYDLFHWKDAHFEFMEGPPAQELIDTDQSITRLSLDVQSLLFEAARRLDEWERIKERISGIDIPYILAKPVDESVSREWPSLETVFKTPASVRRVSDELQIPLYEGAGLMVTLVDAGTIRTVTAQEAVDISRAALDRGHADEAAALIRSIRPLVNDQPHLLHACAEGLIHSGHGTEAPSFYQRAAEIYEQTGQPDMARAEYASALQSLPDHAELRLASFRFLMKQGRMDDARTELISTIAVLGTQERSEEAAGLCSEFLGQAPEDVMIHLHLGELHAKRGDKEQAHAEVKIVQKLLPDDLKQREEILKRLSLLAPAGVFAPSVPQGPPKKRRYVRIALIVAVLAVVGAVCARAYLEVRGKVRLGEARRSASALEKDGKLPEALEVFESFRKGPDGSRWLVRGSLDEDIRRLKEVVEIQQKTQPVVKPPGPTGLSPKQLAELEQRMQQAFLRGNRSLTVQLAQQLLQEATAAKDKDYAGRAAEILKKLDQYEQQAAGQSSLARDLVKQGKVKDAVTAVKKLLKEYPMSEAAKSATFPLRIQSRPSGARLFQNNIDRGATPVIIYLPQDGTMDVRLQKDGFTVLNTAVRAADSGEIMLDLLKLYTWRFPAGSPLELPPAAYGDSLVYSSHGTVTAISPAERGRALWSYSVPSDVEAPPVVIKSRVVFGSNDGTLYALTADQQKPQVSWKAGVTDPIKTKAIYLSAKDAIVFASTDGYVHAVDSHGTPLWKLKLPSRAVDLAAADAGTAVAACSDGTVMAFSGPASQEVLWKRELKKTITRGPVQYRHVVAVGCSDGSVTGLRAASGDVLWTKPAADSVTMLSYSEGEALYVGGRNGSVTALNAADGAILWTVPTDSAVYGDAVRSGSKIFFGNDSGEVYCIESASGAVQWTFKADGRIRSRPVVRGRTVIVGSSDKNIYAIDVE